VASSLRFSLAMTTGRDEPQSLLRWVFRQGGRYLSCSLIASDDGYDVCVVPYWNLDASTIQVFEDAAAAFGRHAQIAMALRGNGWALVEQGSAAAARMPATKHWWSMRCSRRSGPGRRFRQSRRRKPRASDSASQAACARLRAVARRRDTTLHEHWLVSLEVESSSCG